MNFALNDIIIYLLVFLSELIGTIIVFGSSAFFLPISVYLLSKNQSLGLLSFFQAATNPIKLLLFIKRIDWKIALIFGIPSLFMVGFASNLAKYVNTNHFRIGIASTLIILILLEILKGFKLPKNPLIELIGGMVSGFVSGLIGTGGAIRGYFMFSFDLPKEILIGTYILIDSSGDLLRAIIYFNNGFYDNTVNHYLAGAFISSLLGNIIGIIILKKLPVHIFKPFLMVTIIILAILLLCGM